MKLVKPGVTRQAVTDWLLQGVCWFLMAAGIASFLGVFICIGAIAAHEGEPVKSAVVVSHQFEPAHLRPMAVGRVLTMTGEPDTWSIIVRRIFQDGSVDIIRREVTKAQWDELKDGDSLPTPSLP